MDLERREASVSSCEVGTCTGSQKTRRLPSQVPVPALVLTIPSELTPIFSPPCSPNLQVRDATTIGWGFCESLQSFTSVFMEKWFQVPNIRLLRSFWKWTPGTSSLLQLSLEAERYGSSACFISWPRGSHQCGGITVSLSDSYLTISRAKRRKMFKPESWGAFSFVLDLWEVDWSETMCLTSRV